METSTVILIIAVIFILVFVHLIFSSNSSTENMGNVSKSNASTTSPEIATINSTAANVSIDPLKIKTDIASKIIDGFTDQITYIEYLKMLTKIDNISYNLINRDTFLTFKVLKGSNKLTVDKIVEKMFDI